MDLLLVCAGGAATLYQFPLSPTHPPRMRVLTGMGMGQGMGKGMGMGMGMGVCGCFSNTIDAAAAVTLGGCSCDDWCCCVGVVCPLAWGCLSFPLRSHFSPFSHFSHFYSSSISHVSPCSHSLPIPFLFPLSPPQARGAPA